MRKLIIAATMTIPLLAIGATVAAAQSPMADETCTFEPSTGTWGGCDARQNGFRIGRFADLAGRNAGTIGRGQSGGLRSGGGFHGGGGHGGGGHGGGGHR